ncbi:MAG: nucleoside 2-deoxyribosyltransferase [Planctomycetaceae bacterium]|nr:nucleoside 2-deoxyribosyltransferase [Planctomycetaceae bacterium]
MSHETDADVVRVYCAGPLFNKAERSEMSAIADVLGEAGYKVYLPHRDGMEFRLILNILVERGWPAPTAAHFLHAAIFALDVYQLAVECDAMVWNLNGRTPDEGAVSEAAIAWTLGKPIVAYKDDVRSLIAGRVNPLLVGMVDFETCEEITEIPDELAGAILRHTEPPLAEDQMPPRLRKAVQDGRRLWMTMGERDANFHDRLIADVVTELFAPSQEVF